MNESRVRQQMRLAAPTADCEVDINTDNADVHFNWFWTVGGTTLAHSVDVSKSNWLKLQKNDVELRKSFSRMMKGAENTMLTIHCATEAAQFVKKIFSKVKSFFNN